MPFYLDLKHRCGHVGVTKCPGSHTREKERSERAIARRKMCLLCQPGIQKEVPRGTNEASV